MRERTLFYPLKPMGEGTPEVESSGSYIRRLAFAHSEMPTTLMRQMLTAFPFDEANGRTVEEIVMGINLGYVVGNRVMQRLEKSTGTRLMATSPVRFNEFLSMRGLQRNEAGTYCPCCVQESSEISYGHLAWELTAVAACPKHGVRLRSAKVCGAPKEEHLKSMNRPSLFGVCACCGSIGFGCMTGEPEPASNYEIWVAHQVGELVALPTAEVEAMTAESVRKGIVAVVKEAFNGSVVRAAKRSGLGRSSVCVWANGTVAPALDSLVRLCFGANASLVALLKGQFVAAQCAEPGGIWSDIPRRQYRKTSLSDQQIREAILAAANQPVPPSAKELARSLNVDVTLLRKRFREEQNVLVASHQKHRDRETQRRYDNAHSLFMAAADSLAKSGKAVGRANLQKLTGWVSYESCRGIRHRAMVDVLGRFNARCALDTASEEECLMASVEGATCAQPSSAT